MGNLDIQLANTYFILWNGLISNEVLENELFRSSRTYWTRWSGHRWCRSWLRAPGARQRRTAGFWPWWRTGSKASTIWSGAQGYLPSCRPWGEREDRHQRLPSCWSRTRPVRQTLSHSCTDWNTEKRRRAETQNISWQSTSSGFRYDNKAAPTESWCELILEKKTPTPLYREPWSQADPWSLRARRAPTSIWSYLRLSWSSWTSAAWSHLRHTETDDEHVVRSVDLN